MRHQLAQEFQPLCHERPRKKLTPVMLPPGRAETCDQAELHRVAADGKYNGNIEVADLAAAPSSRVRRQSPRPSTPTRPPAPAVDRIDYPPSDIRSPLLALDVTSFGEALTECGKRSAAALGDPTLSHPITGIAACCARAAIGHAAAPPSSATTRVASCRAWTPSKVPPPIIAVEPPGAGGLTHQEPMGAQGPQVLGVDLNCSEIQRGGGGGGF